MGFSPLKLVACGLIRFYQSSLSPLFPSCCRFSPTCSQYALEAFGKYGFLQAMWKSIWRILRCNPFSQGGIDRP